MSIESSQDWDGLRAAAAVARATLGALRAAVRPGVTTLQLDRVAATVFVAHGATSAPASVYGFPGTVLISVNDEVVHGVPGPRRLADGDLVKLDVTVEKDGYVADAARTVIVGAGSLVARRLRGTAEKAFAAAIGVLRAGTPLNRVGQAIERMVQQAGFSVVRELCGHGVGRTIHEPPDVPNYYDPDRVDVLTAGLVLAVEPIICAGRGEIVQSSDGWTVSTRDRSLAAHHENTIVITTGMPIVLTQDW